MGAIAAGIVIPNLKQFKNSAGAVATYNRAGNIDESNAFFQPLGTNGRTCATCHQPDQAFSLSAKGVREVYERTHGLDPLFVAVDGANCPTSSPTTTPDDRASHSLLLGRGLIRVGITLPADPQFTIAVVHDPYGCAITSDGATGRPVISVYRRPLPSANLRFLSTVMFDGRETVVPLNKAATFESNLNADLAHQVISAVTTHAQGVAPTVQQINEVVQFELGLSTAQIHDEDAGLLEGRGAAGGPVTLSRQSYYPGINDALGGDPHGVAFRPSAFSLYAGWAKGEHRERGEDSEKNEAGGNEAREEIAAGEKLFNTQPAILTDVRGLNDNAALGSPASITGTCTTCHDTPNVGNHSVALPLDIATSRQAGVETNAAVIAGLNQLSAPDLPVYEVRGCPDALHAGSTVNFYTSDPGKALVTGLCSDVNRGKGPVLRGLAARAPYFHNGAAANLDELVNFYNQRFQMKFTAKEKRELIAFLNSL